MFFEKREKIRKNLLTKKEYCGIIDELSARECI